MRPIEQDFPEGSLITERIEVVAAIIPSGESVLSYRATTSDGEPIEATRFLGLLERVKMDSWMEEAQ